MNQTNKILVGVAAGQLVLVALTWTLASTIGTGSDATPLIDSMKADEVTELTISSGPKDGKTTPPVTLEKRGDAWVVASAEGYPAKADTVTDLVKKIVDLKVREPVATNKGNHAVLKVSDTTYDKKVHLKAGSATADLVIGSAKGSSVHARFEGKDEVFLARGVSSYALSDRASTFVDTQYLAVKEPTAVTVKNDKGVINLTKTDAGGWTVAQLPADVDVDDSRVKAFVNAASTVVLAEPVGKTVKPEYGLDAGVRVEVTSAEGTRAYRIGAEADGKVYVKADDNDFVVKVAKYSVDTLRTQVPNNFVKEAVEPPSGGGMPGMPGGGMPGGGQLPPELMQQIQQMQMQQMQEQGGQ